MEGFVLINLVLFAGSIRKRPASLIDHSLPHECNFKAFIHLSISQHHVFYEEKSM